MVTTYDSLNLDLLIESAQIPTFLVVSHGLLGNSIINHCSETSLYCDISLNSAEIVQHIDFLAEALPYLYGDGLQTGSNEGALVVVRHDVVSLLLVGLPLYILEQLLIVVALESKSLQVLTIDAGDDSRALQIDTDADLDTIFLTSASESIFRMPIPRQLFVDEVLRLGVSFVDFFNLLKNHPLAHIKDKQTAETYSQSFTSMVKKAHKSNRIGGDLPVFFE